jgi:nucleoside-diphosphate-sugar epimerase
MSQRPWLLTGASGFLGRHLLQVAAGGGRRVIALVRDPDAWASHEWTRELDVERVVGSVTDGAAWQERLPALGGIVHAAAVVRHSRRGPDDMLETNVGGTLAMVDLAAAHGCRVVTLSTSGTVGCFRTPEPRADETAPFCEAEVGSWPYYASKIAAERRARQRAEELGVDLVILRPPVLLGPGDHRYRSTSNVLRFLRGGLPFLVRGGMHFADVRDGARAVLAALERPGARPVYHLPGTECGIEAFFGMLAEVSGVPAPRFVLPFRPARWIASATSRLHVLPDPVVVEMASHYWGASSLFAAELGYKSREPEETLRDTVTWLRASHPAFARDHEE